MKPTHRSRTLWLVHLLLALALGLSACTVPPVPAPIPLPPSSPTPAPLPPAPVPAAEPEATCAEILWDDWGVPHIYAETEDHLAYALGWAQMQSHGNLILDAFGKARGRAAELWGEEHLASDQYMWTVGVPQLAAELHDGGGMNDAFAAGMNAYAEAHPNELDEGLKAVLPLTGQDVLAQTIFTIYAFYAPADGINGFSQQYLAGDQASADPQPASPTSNGWAIGPSKSVSGSPILLVNPHIFWPNMPGYSYVVPYEVHLVGPDLDFYGATFIGANLPSFGFNDHLGWTFTSTPLDVTDFYELTLAEGGYLFDGEVKAFNDETVTLNVKQGDGSMREQSFQVLRSIHGPVIAQKGDKAVAVQLPPLDFGDRVQHLEMARATNLDEFTDALDLQQLTPLNFIYADREGNIMYTLVGMIPDRPEGDFDWSGILPGDTSASLWRGMLPYSRMPRVVNPATGYVQNANEPPWTTTLPSGLDPADYPADWPGPDMFPRAARSLEMITARDSFSMADVMADKYSTHSLVADRVLDDLIAAAQQYGSPVAQEAAGVLANWDRTFDANNPGSVLFAFWAMQLEPEILGAGRFPEAAFAVPTDPTNPFETPMGLADPAAAVAALEVAARALPEVFGSLYVPWGAFVHFRLGNQDLPGFGQGWGPFGFGSFTPNLAMPQPDGALATVYGDTWVAVVEFTDPLQAVAVMPYGNATQPASAHVADQLPLYAAKQYRPVWRTRAEIEANLALHETLDSTGLIPCD